MVIEINTGATLRSMDFHWDSRKRESYVKEATTHMAARLAEIGADCRVVGEKLIVERNNGRGMLLATRQAAKAACGIYGEVSVV